MNTLCLYRDVVPLPPRVLARDNDVVSMANDQSSATIARKSVWRIIAPLLLLPFVLPSTAVLIITALGVGPARPGESNCAVGSWLAVRMERRSRRD